MTVKSKTLVSYWVCACLLTSGVILVIWGRLVVSVSTSSRVKRTSTARLLTTGLHGSAARNHDDQLGAEVGEDIGAGLAKTIAISQQHDHGGDAPGHAQHGERSAAAVVPHGAVGFAEQITEHMKINW